MNKVLKVYPNEKIKNNYIYLSTEIANSLYFENKEGINVKIVKLKKFNSEKNMYLGYIGGLSSKENTIEISTKLSESLNLKPGELIKLSFEDDIFSFYGTDNLNSLSLVPLTNYDYKLVEINSEFFEENLLNQIMVVFDGLIFPFVFFDNKIAYLKVNLDCKNKGFLLSQDCEVNVAFIPEEEKEKEDKSNLFDIYSNDDIFFVSFDEKLNEQEKFDKIYSIINSNNFLINNSIRINSKFLRENKIFNIDNHDDLFSQEDINNSSNKEKKVKTNLFANVAFKFKNMQEIISKINDFDLIGKIYDYTNDSNTKFRENNENFNFINANVFSKLLYLSNLWFNLEIDDTLDEFEIKIPEFFRIFSIFSENEHVELKIVKRNNKKIEELKKKFEDKNLLKFLIDNLKLEFSYPQGYLCNQKETLEILKDKFFLNLVKYLENKDFIIFNLDVINKFSYENFEFFYRLKFDNIEIYNKYYDIITRNIRSNFCKIFYEYEVAKLKNYKENIDSSLKFLSGRLLKSNVIQQNLNEENKINYLNFLILNKSSLFLLFSSEWSKNLLKNITNIDENKINNNSVSISLNNEIKNTLNYILSMKSQRHIINNNIFDIKFDEDSNETIDTNHLNTFEKNLILEDIKVNILQDLINFYEKSKKSDIKFINRPKNYNFRLFLDELKKNISSNITRRVELIYLNFSIFQITNYNTIQYTKKYLECFFDDCLIKFQNKEKNRIIFLFDNFNWMKSSQKSYDSHMDPTDKFQKNKEYIITKLIISKLKPFFNVNKIKNKFYFIFASESNSSNLNDIYPINFLVKLNNISFDSIHFIEKNHIESIILFILDIIRKSFYKSEENKIELKNFTKKTEDLFILIIDLLKNVVFFDIRKLINIFIDFNKKNTNTNKNTLRNDEFIFYLLTDFKLVIENYTPCNNILNDKFVKLNNDFSDVGGLKKVKSQIYDTIHLSMKCTEIFRNKNPIKLSTGILLIGPPGCGKTFIAATIQKEFKINFFSVKGPEILNKYIGASEAAVREIFESAKMAIPCVIFLDEFDSIAPKRGSGSSGVTDRIVNQLLTYLDGIESRDGVFIIAASSRPDLIDPAMLRPGRLDKMLNCDFPNEEERLEILKKYYDKSLNTEGIEDEGERIELEEIKNKAFISLENIAKKTEFYTGADLQSLIYNSFLFSVKKNIQKNLDKHPIITDEEIYKAFKDFKKSLTNKDIQFYNEIKFNYLGRTEGNNLNKGNFEEQAKKNKKLIDTFKEDRTTLY